MKCGRWQASAANYDGQDVVQVSSFIKIILYVESSFPLSDRDDTAIVQPV